MAKTLCRLSGIGFSCEIANRTSFEIIGQRRLRAAQKGNWNLMVYLMCRSGLMSNEQIGQLLGLSYSAVSHVVKTLKVRMRDNPELMKKNRAA